MIHYVVKCTRDSGPETLKISALDKCIFLCMWRRAIFSKVSLQPTLSIDTHQRATILHLLYHSPVKDKFVVSVMTSELLVLN